MSLRKKILIIGFLSIQMALFQNCSMVSRPQDHLGSSSTNVLEREAMKVINAKCVGCHNAENPSGGVDYLTKIDTLLYFRMVVPGEPQLSYLYTIITDGAMPPQPTTLTSTEIKAIYDWIQDGFTDPSAIGVSPPPATVLEPKFSSISQLILRPKCVGCHNSTNAAKGVNLSTYNSTMNTVQPGNLDASSLWISITRGGMPQGGMPLNSAERTAIQSWIMNGAPNN